MANQKKPLHFIYFDEDRISSYLSQIDEGFIEAYQTLESKSSVISGGAKAFIAEVSTERVLREDVLNKKRMYDYIFTELLSKFKEYIIDCTEYQTFKGIDAALNTYDIVHIKAYIHFIDFNQISELLNSVDDLNELIVFASLSEDEYNRCFVMKTDKAGRETVTIPKEYIKIVSDLKESVMTHKTRKFIKQYRPFVKLFVGIDNAIKCYLSRMDGNYLFGVIDQGCMREPMAALKMKYGSESQEKFNIIAIVSRKIAYISGDSEKELSVNNMSEKEKEEEIIEKESAGEQFVKSTLDFIKSQERMYSPVKQDNYVITPLAIYH